MSIVLLTIGKAWRRLRLGLWPGLADVRDDEGWFADIERDDLAG
jgi:hypothetical protein